MLKKYTSKSDISLSVRITDDGSAHISFSPLTGGGSVYYTKDEDMQKALESHSKFGRLFKEVEMPVYEETTDGASTEEGAAEEQSAYTTIHVDSLDDAKEYLSDHYGVSRTKLRTKKSIVETAASKGLIFEGI